MRIHIKIYIYLGMNILSKVIIEFLFQLRFGKYHKEDAELALPLLMVCGCVQENFYF